MSSSDSPSSAASAGMESSQNNGGCSPWAAARAMIAGRGLKAQATWVAVGDGITLVGIMLSAMALARMVRPADMATFKQVTYLGMMAVAFTEIGLPSAVYRFHRILSVEDRVAFLWSVGIALLGLGLLGTLGLRALAGPLSRAYHNEGLKTALSTCAAYPLFVLPFSMVRPVMISRGHSIKATSFETFFALASAVALVVPIGAGRSLDAALRLWMAVHASRLLIVVWCLAPELRGSAPLWRPELISRVWAYTWPIQLSRIPSMAMAYADKVITSLFLPTELFAVYALGARELPYLNRIPFSLSSVVLPRLSEAMNTGNERRVYELWRKACISTAMVTYPFAAFCVWHARPIVRALFTSSYDQAAVPFAACAGITFVRVIEYASLAKAREDSSIILRVAVLAAIISIPVAALLTALWGIWGMSAFLFLSQFIIAACYIAYYRMVLMCPVRVFFPWPTLLVILAIAFASVALVDGTVGSLVGVRARTETIPLILAIILLLLGSLLVYAVAVWVFVARPRDHWVAAANPTERA